LLNKDVYITEREWQCIKLLEYGLSSRETAEILGISRRTVETHFVNIKIKLNINSKDQILEINKVREENI
ncbi:MAG: helix-turn-helix transcriptional regulator, partial [Legionellales bacterium]|nr:helix-turn-helix transcriptional regulator [Legionellales bacterium]